MPRIRCHYIDCVYIEDGYCEASKVEVDPDEGCLTYSRFDDVPEVDTWDEESMEDVIEDDDEEVYSVDEADDHWLEEEDAL